MITLAPNVRVYLACGVTDLRKGMTGLAMLVQQTLAEDPFGGAAFAFRGRRAGLIKLPWHGGIGLCLLTKRLEQGAFIWPAANTTGRIVLSAAQLAALLDGIDWRAQALRRRPELAGRKMRRLRPAFLQVLLLARESGLLGVGTVSIDGTKIDANALTILGLQNVATKWTRISLTLQLQAHHPPVAPKPAVAKPRITRIRQTARS